MNIHEFFLLVLQKVKLNCPKSFRLIQVDCLHLPYRVVKTSLESLSHLLDGWLVFYVRALFLVRKNKGNFSLGREVKNKRKVKKKTEDFTEEIWDKKHFSWKHFSCVQDIKSKTKIVSLVCFPSTTPSVFYSLLSVIKCNITLSTLKASSYDLKLNSRMYAE